MATKKYSTDVTILNNRIGELEAQLSNYKKRLDDLRKAKNTTILKRERELVEIGAPQLGRRGSRLSQTALPDDLDELKSKYQKELDDLKKKHKADLEAIKMSSQCNHEEELTRLRSRVECIEADNAAILLENKDLKDRSESLLQELSVKEASWCETEEQLKQKIKMQWGEKYQEWMESTEKKIEELQQANMLLRKLVKKPRGPDPSGQDDS